MKDFEGTIGIDDSNKDKFVVSNTSEIPHVDPVQTPVDYPRSEEKRNGEGMYDQTKHGEGYCGTNTAGY